MSEMRLRQLQRQIDDIIKYIKPLLPMANCHMVEFITLDHWNNFVPKPIIQEVKDYGAQKAIDAFWQVRHELSNKNVDSACDSVSRFLPNDTRTKFKHLINFVEEADRHYLKGDGVLCLTVDQLKNKLQKLGGTNLDSLKLKEFMSDKKSHEVEVLSSMVATLASITKVDYTIELGGGRGFLAAMLNMFYGMPVLNIDCCEVNAKGAQERNRKLQKLWPGLVRKAEESKSGTVKERVGRSHKYKKKNLPSTGKNSEAAEDLNSNVATSSERVKSVTEKINKLDIENNINNNPKVDSLYRHVTEFVTHDTDLLSFVRESFDNSSDLNICLTGLHTCGDLGSTTLKLYNKCSSASVLCAVPCCYHLLTELVQENQLSESEVCSQGEQAGFPMSHYLKGFSIGRNARMLASQSIDRISALQDVPSDSLFYRALLQVLLQKYDNGNTVLEGKMKKVAGKCTNFSQYVNAALLKLSLNSEMFQFTDEELNSFRRNHESYNENLIMFYLLRMCLAQVVESLILYDRLLFLGENGFFNETGEAFLVKMFDPVVSPRCHALVAFRKSYIDK